VRGDRAGHGGAVLMRLVVAAERVEVLQDHAVQVRIFDIDLGIDQRDGDILAGGDPMRLLDLQFAQHILLGIALAGEGHLRGILLQREKIVRLHARDDALVLDRADEIADRTAAVDAPAVDGGAEKRQVDRFELRQIMPARELLDRLRRGAGRKRRDHFVRHEAAFAARRHPAAGPATTSDSATTAATAAEAVGAGRRRRRRDIRGRRRAAIRNRDDDRMADNRMAGRPATTVAVAIARVAARPARRPRHIGAAAAPRRHDRPTHRRTHAAPHANAAAAEAAHMSKAHAAEGRSRARRAADAQQHQRESTKR
jgi:hypothetical protein